MRASRALDRFRSTGRAPARSMRDDNDMTGRGRVALALGALIALLCAGFIGVARAQDPSRYGRLSLVPPTHISVDGREKKAAVPGKQNEVRFSLRNKGDRSFSALRLEILSEFAIKIETPHVTIRLPARAMGTAAVRFFFTESRCWNPLTIQVGAQTDPKGSEGLGNVTIPAACSQKPLLEVATVQYEGGDNDGVPEPGERLVVEVSLMNRERQNPVSINGPGQGYPARNISARLVSETPGVTVVQPGAGWPDAKPAASPEFIPPLGAFEIRIAPWVPRVRPPKDNDFGLDVHEPGWDGKCGKPRTTSCLPAAFRLSLNVVATGFTIQLPIGEASVPSAGRGLWTSVGPLAAVGVIVAVMGFFIIRRRRKVADASRA